MECCLQKNKLSVPIEEITDALVQEGAILLADLRTSTRDICQFFRGSRVHALSQGECLLSTVLA